MSKNTILIIHHNSSSTGSIVYRIEKIISRLSQNYKLFFASPDSQLAKKNYSLENVEVVSIKMTENNNLLRYLINFLKFIKYLLQKRINLIYIVDFNFWRPAELVAAKLLKVPIIAHFTTLKSKEFNQGFMKEVNFATANSKATLNSLISIPNHKKKHVYNFIDFSQFEEVVAKENSGNQFKIICVAQLNHMKGIDILIKAVSKIDSKYNVKTTIVGSEKEQGYLDFLKNIAQQEKTSNLEFLAYHADLKPLLELSDLLVLPSRHSEGFGYVLLEAAACGLAVIGSDVGGIPEVITQLDNGLIFKNEDVEDLKDKIEYLITNPQIKTKFQKNAKINSKKYFSEGTILTSIADDIDSILRKK